MSTIDLALLPPPEIVETLSFEEIQARLIGNVAFRLNAAGIPYTVGMLETDPTAEITQAISAEELLIRQRINEAFLATLLAKARGGDLDQLAVFYDVVRLPGEEDDRLRLRTTLSNQSPLTGGTAPRYRYHALAADIRVRDAVVYRTGTRPVVNVAIYSTDNGGVADPALIAKVQAALDHPDVRMVSDTIIVRSAVFSTVNIEADVWLLPSAQDGLLDAMRQNLRAVWDTERSLGFDLNASWIIARLMQPGVARVSLIAPASDQTAAPESAIGIGTITLNNKGRSF